MGETLTPEERTLFRQLTGRTHEPNRRVEEFVGVIGRRGGKSRAISVLATFLAALCDHPALVAGEKGLVLLVAPDVHQADVVFNFIEANFRQSPILRQLIHSRTRRTLRLTNRIEIEVRAGDFRRLRGPTYIAVICDEVAFLRSEDSANPDTEILNAVRPGLATTHGPLFLISSPYARRGELWNLYRQHYGPAGDPLILVAQADSRTMNGTLAQGVVDRATERDPASAAAEYGASFRTDLEAFVLREAVEACVSTGVHERPPVGGPIKYSCFVDPSGGSSDSFTLAIAHHERSNDVVVIDAVRERRPPFSPEATVREFCIFIKSYGILKVTGDRYGGEWPREQFRKLGINYMVAESPASDLYLNLLPLINSGRISLLDHTRLINQLISLERRTARSGKDSISHPPGGHDDVSNAVAGVASLSRRTPMRFSQEVKQWASVPQRFDGRWHSFGIRRQPLVNIDARPGAFPSGSPPEPVLPVAPGTSASSRLIDGTSTTRTPYTEFINTINNSRNE
jgi:hypothetical protein